jgi:N,N'-diacetyllegionaminate synthase
MQTSVLVIAECGVNFQGDEEHAYRLIDAAIAAKADVCKFQLYKPELLTTREEPEKYLMLKSLLLERDAYVRLYQYCAAHHIGFACTAFDADSLQFLLGNTKMEFVKISSGQWQNKHLLNAAKNSGLRIIQSMKEGALRFFDGDERYYGKNNAWHWAHIHVVPQYPTPPEKAKLRELENIWCRGISDHSGDIFIPLAAVALGAQIIESHITLNKSQSGPDHKASLEPHQFAEMVRGIRCIEKALQ